MIMLVFICSQLSCRDRRIHGSWQRAVTSTLATAIRSITRISSSGPNASWSCSSRRRRWRPNSWPPSNRPKRWTAGPKWSPKWRRIRTRRPPLPPPPPPSVTRRRASTSTRDRPVRPPSEDLELSPTPSFPSAKLPKRNSWPVVR